MKSISIKIINLLLLTLLLSACQFVIDPEYNKDDSEYNTRDNDNKEITVSTVDELMSSVYETKVGNVTVLIKDGTYKIPNRLWISGDNVTYKSESGNRENVIIKGDGYSGSVGFIFSVAGKDFTAQDLTIGEVKYHGVQVHGELDADNVNLINIHFYDINQQNIKGSYDKTGNPDKHADNGLIEDCLFEYRSGIANQYYCGGVDVHHGENWIVRNNIFKNIISPTSSLTEGAIHFWTESSNTVVKDNIIINCDRGIMLGFDSTNQYGGEITGNSIHTVKDTGIYLCNSKDITVSDNIIFIESNYNNAIEYRFNECSNIIIKNNTTNKNITSRDGATATLENNNTSATMSLTNNQDIKVDSI